MKELNGWFIWAAAIAVTWVTWITARSFNSLSRKDHEALCEKRQREVDALLARIEQKIDNNEARASQTRHDIRDSVNLLTTQVAVLNSRMQRSGDK